MTFVHCNVARPLYTRGQSRGSKAREASETICASWTFAWDEREKEREREKEHGRGWNTNRNWNSTNTRRAEWTPIRPRKQRLLAASTQARADSRYRPLTTRLVRGVGVRTTSVASHLADRDKSKIYERRFPLPLSLTSIGCNVVRYHGAFPIASSNCETAETLGHNLSQRDFPIGRAQLRIWNMIECVTRWNPFPQRVAKMGGYGRLDLTSRVAGDWRNERCHGEPRGIRSIISVNSRWLHIECRIIGVSQITANARDQLGGIDRTVAC